MAISKIGGTGSDNWELISSVTPTAASTAVNFTGLSPYKKLMVMWQGIVLAAATDVTVRLNNDFSQNHTNYRNTNSGSVGSSSFTTQWPFGDGGTVNQNGYAIVNNCDNAGVKILEDGYAVSSNTYGYYRGFYRGSAIINQVSFVTTSTFTAVGTVALYGVK
jgi:hypothetical protein